MKKKDYRQKISFRARLIAEYRRLAKIGKRGKKLEKTDLDGMNFIIVGSKIPALKDKVIQVLGFSPRAKKFVVKLLRFKYRGTNKFLMSHDDIFKHTQRYTPSKPPAAKPEATPSLAPAAKPARVHKKMKRVVAAGPEDARKIPLYRAIKSVLPKKSAYTILRYVQIKDKTVFATDLDLFFVKKDPEIAALENGMYLMADKNYVKTAMDTQEFPEIPNYGNKYKHRVGSINRKQLVAQLLKAGNYNSTDISRRPMIGILLHAVNDHYGRIIATDGAQMYTGEIDLINFVPGQYILGQPDKLIDVFRNFDDVEFTITAESDPAQEFPRSLAFNGADGFIVSRLLEGPYPNYEAVEQKCNRQVIVDRNLLEQTLKDWRPYVREFQDRNPRIAVIFRANEMIIYSQAALTEEASFPDQGFVKASIPITNREVFYKPELGSLIMPLRVDHEFRDESGMVAWWFDYGRFLNVVQTYGSEKLFIGFDWNGFDPVKSSQKSVTVSDADLADAFKIEKYEHEAPKTTELQLEYEKMTAEGKTFLAKVFNESPRFPEVVYTEPIMDPDTNKLVGAKVVKIGYNPERGLETETEQINHDVNGGDMAINYIKTNYGSRAETIDWQPARQYTEWLSEMKDWSEAHIEAEIEQEAGEHASEDIEKPEGEPPHEPGEPAHEEADYHFGTALVKDQNRLARINLPEDWDVLSPDTHFNRATGRYEFEIVPGLLVFSDVQGIIFKIIDKAQSYETLTESPSGYVKVVKYAREDGTKFEDPVQEFYTGDAVADLIPVREVAA